MPSHPILLLGAGDLADEVRGALDALGAEVVRLPEPTQRELAAVFERGPVERAVVVSGDDAFALRTALMVRDADPDVELLITYFDSATAGELSRRVKHCRVTSMADIVAPTLAGPCLDESLGAIRLDEGRVVGVRTDGDEVEELPVDVPDRRRVRALVGALLAPYDKSAALLFYGAVGLVAILIIETVAAAIVLPQTAGSLALLSLAVLVGGSSIRDSVGWGGTIDGVWDVARWPVGIALAVASIAVLFEYAPRRRQPEPSWLAFGAATSALLWLCFMAVLVAYVEATGNFGATYGPLAGTIGVLLWTFLSAVALFLGLAFAAQLEAVRAGVGDPRVARDEND